MILRLLSICLCFQALIDFGANAVENLNPKAKAVANEGLLFPKVVFSPTYHSILKQ